MSELIRCPECDGTFHRLHLGDDGDTVESECVGCGTVTAHMTVGFGRAV